MELPGNITEYSLFSRGCEDVETSFEDIVYYSLARKFPDFEKVAFGYSRNNEIPGDDVPEDFKKELEEFRKKEIMECWNCSSPLWDDAHLCSKPFHKDVYICKDCYPQILIKWLFELFYDALRRIVWHFFY